MSVQRIELDLGRIKDEIGQMSSSQIDELPFGAIQLDDAGKVVTYNRYEEKFAKRERSEVVGKNFFHEVAPCTRVRRQCSAACGCAPSAWRQRTMASWVPFTRSVSPM